ncbi:transposase [candidate division WOR-3 bacterium]|nr:transposase [candidate division WOR-3 bacterium]
MITCGVDPSRGSFSVSFVENMTEFEYKEYENSPRGFEQFIKKIKPLKSAPTVCIEGYGDFAKQLAMYLKTETIKVCEINPKMSNRLKGSITEHKTDHIDAFTCSLFPYFRDDLKELTLDIRMEGLRNLCRLYTKVSKQVTKSKNQLHAALNQNFGPVYKKFFNNLNPTSINFYVQYGSYEEIEEASVADIHKALKKGDSCIYKGKYGRKRAKEIKEAVKRLNYHPLLEFGRMQSEVIKSYAKMLLIVMEQKNEIKDRIVKYVGKSFPDYKSYFEGIKGISELRFAQLISEIKDINNFRSDSHLASYSGQSPRIHQSASISKTRTKRDYNRYLAHLIHMITCENIRKGGRFYDVYTQMKGKYSKKLRAMKNIKRKIVRLLYYKLKDYMTYLKQEKNVKKDILNVS